MYSAAVVQQFLLLQRMRGFKIRKGKALDKYVEGFYTEHIL